VCFFKSDLRQIFFFSSKWSFGFTVVHFHLTLLRDLCNTCASKLVPFLVEWVRIFLMLKVAKQMFADVNLTVVTATVLR
jgi:hypothetical protein